MSSDETLENEDVKRESLSRIYWQGFAINLLNPKTALFFFALFPQFIDSTKGNVMGQNLVLGAIFIGMALITDSLYALLASSLAGKLSRNNGFQKGQRYFAGLVYVGLGITTALTGSKK
jgi:threonine/homoserine/homoserine lactone efflux protein